MSCTKAFTATCVGILVDEGKLKWNDKVIKYLPHFKLSDPWITKEIPISDLLSHRSGLRTFDGDLLWYGTNYSSNEIIDKIQYYPIENEFRLDFKYNNVMYLIAGKIIEKVTGQTWHEFLRIKIFEQLGTKNSSTTISGLTQNINHALPHIANKPITPRSLDNVAPAGSINSTIDDMLLWLQMYLNKGKTFDEEIISKETFETITSPKIITDNKGLEGYGFGWYIGYENKQKVLFHSGGMPGYKSMIALYPENSLGIVVLTNKISLINEGLINMISSYVTKPDLIDWSDNRTYFSHFGYSWDNPEKTKMSSNLPLNFDQYKGLYEDDVYGKASICSVNGKGILKLLPSKELFSGTLYPVDSTKFKIKLKDEFLPMGEVVFEINKNGNIESFRMKIPSGDFNFDNLKFKKIKTGGNNGSYDR